MGTYLRPYRPSDVLVREYSTNNKFTEGKAYTAIQRGQDVGILDDNGKFSIPCQNPHYWRFADESELNTTPEPTKTLGDNMKPALKVTKINYTDINGKPASQYTEAEIVEMVISEKQLADRLSSLNLNSKAVGRIMLKHQTNINILLEELEALSPPDPQ